jgi:Family of unknown function (DUF6328)
VESKESPDERHSRELIELLNELRVALPGVQVLFAFLLAVPFAQGWQRTSAFQRDVFFVAFIAAAVSSVLLIAPSSIHRIGWRVSNKGEIVRVSNWLAVVGLGALAVAMTAVTLFVTDYIFTRGAAIATAVCVGACFVAVWYGLALYLRSRG